MAEYYTNPQRAAEESKHNKAISSQVRLTVDGHVVLGQVVYNRGDFAFTYAGLKTVPIRNLDRGYVTSIIDNVHKWKPL